MASNVYSLYEWGANDFGQLGNGKEVNTDYINTPSLLTSLPKGLNINDIQAVSCGEKHTLLLTKSGYIYATGKNDVGQLGIIKTTSTQVDTFTLCQGIDEIQGKIKAISCGYNHTALLTIFGYIYATGSNGLGQLGIDITISNVDKFTLCTNFDNKQGHIKAISCGAFHTALLTAFGFIYTTGSNNFGPLGIPKNQTNPNVFYLDKFTKCYSGKDIDKIQGKIKAISCGDNHTALLTKSGYIYATGQNNLGQLGIGTNGNIDEFTKCKGIDKIQGNIKAISCGGYHTALLTKSGYIYATGWNEYGQLGIPITTLSQINTFTICTNFDNKQGKIKSISCGEFHTALLTTFGQIYTTGYNFFGQLGIPISQCKIKDLDRDRDDIYYYYLDTFTAIVPNATHSVENINNKFSWISDGCSANSVFAYKNIISNKKNCDKSDKIWCNLDFSC
jgi:alpha-tubulin suppressor-like RCC1 family protein